MYRKAAPFVGAVRLRRTSGVRIDSPAQKLAARRAPARRAGWRPPAALARGPARRGLPGSRASLARRGRERTHRAHEDRQATRGPGGLALLRRCAAETLAALGREQRRRGGALGRGLDHLPAVADHVPPPSRLIAG